MNEYQSSILHANSVYVSYRRYEEGDRPFPIDYDKRYTRHPPVLEYVAPNGYFGHIEFSDDEDISEYTEIYAKLYGDPIELDSSYLDMVSNSKKLTVSCSWGGSAEINTKTTSFSANIEGDFDAANFVTPSVFDPEAGYLSTVKKDRSSRASQLNHDLLYGSFKSNTGIILEGETPLNTGFYDNYYFYYIIPIADYEQLTGTPLPRIQFRIDSSSSQAGTSYGETTSLDYSASCTSQKGGSASVSFTSSVTMDPPKHYPIYGESLELIVGVATIVVTPTKIYAWPFLSGTIADPMIIISSVSDPDFISGLGIGEGPYEKVGDFPFNFLGVNITGFVYKSNGPFYVNTVVQSVSFGGSFNITKEEEY
jgi:hypothetical protein